MVVSVRRWHFPRVDLFSRKYWLFRGYGACSLVTQRRLFLSGTFWEDGVHRSFVHVHMYFETRISVTKTYNVGRDNVFWDIL